MIDLAEREKTAAHEAGHLVAAYLSPEVKSLDGVWFLPEKAQVGCTMRKRPDLTDHYWHRLVITFAGLAGEVVHHGRYGRSGAKNDLDEAQNLVRRLLSLDPRTTPPWQRVEPSIGNLKLEKLFTIDPPETEAVIFLEAYRKAKKSLLGARETFDRIRQRVVLWRDIPAQELRSFFGPRPWVRT